MKQHIVISASAGTASAWSMNSPRPSRLWGSISESRMTSLGNEFAMLLLVNGNWHTLAKLEGESRSLPMLPA